MIKRKKLQIQTAYFDTETNSIFQSSFASSKKENQFLERQQQRKKIRQSINPIFANDFQLNIPQIREISNRNIFKDDFKIYGIDQKQLKIQVVESQQYGKKILNNQQVLYPTNNFKIQNTYQFNPYYRQFYPTELKQRKYKPYQKQHYCIFNKNQYKIKKKKNINITDQYIKNQDQRKKVLNNILQNCDKIKEQMNTFKPTEELYEILIKQKELHNPIYYKILRQLQHKNIYNNHQLKKTQTQTKQPINLASFDLNQKIQIKILKKQNIQNKSNQFFDKYKEKLDNQLKIIKDQLTDLKCQTTINTNLTFNQKRQQQKPLINNNNNFLYSGSPTQLNRSIIQQNNCPNIIKNQVQIRISNINKQRYSNLILQPSKQHLPIQIRKQPQLITILPQLVIKQHKLIPIQQQFTTTQPDLMPIKPKYNSKQSQQAFRQNKQVQNKHYSPYNPKYKKVSWFKNPQQQQKMVTTSNKYNLKQKSNNIFAYYPYTRNLILKDYKLI